MMAASENEIRGAVSAFWQDEYACHLGQRLDRSLDYLRDTPEPEQHVHARSFLALLAEARRYPALQAKVLAFIAALHPLPLRWGLTAAWEPELRFALENAPGENVTRHAEYRCALGDLLLYAGRFDEALDQSRRVMNEAGLPVLLLARAKRIAFYSLRATGRPAEADALVEKSRTRFRTDLHAQDVPREDAAAWLLFNQSWLELLRERGQTGAALALVDEMIALDRRLGAMDRIQTADLLTHRSTLLWVLARYAESAADLTACIQLYREAGDLLNAAARQGNLGLVYWSMGQLDLAEVNLKSALAACRKFGLEQMFTYVTGNLGLVYFLQGHLDQAIQITGEHIERAKKLNFVSDVNRGLCNLAMMRYYQGDYQFPLDVYASTREYYEKRGLRDSHYAHFNWAALCHQQLGEHEKAVELVNQAIRAAREHGSLLLEQISQRCLASLLPREQREAPLLRSLHLAEQTGRKTEIAATWLALAAVFADEERRAQAWKTGSDLLREIGAGAWLEGRSMQDPPFIPLSI